MAGTCWGSRHGSSGHACSIEKTTQVLHAAVAVGGLWLGLGKPSGLWLLASRALARVVAVVVAAATSAAVATRVRVMPQDRGVAM